MRLELKLGMKASCYSYLWLFFRHNGQSSDSVGYILLSVRLSYGSGRVPCKRCESRKFSHTSCWDTQTVEQVACVCGFQMRVFWMRAPTCCSFNSLQKFGKWGLLLDPILCHTMCSAYSPGVLTFQQLFLYTSLDNNLRLSTTNLSVLCMPVT